MSNPTGLPDQHAREAIETDLDRNMLVEAGAGSGKTESLARRMVAGIVEGTYVIDHMAAVTFTRKAAAELRERCQVALERRLKAEQEATRRTRIQDALSHLERLFVGTIHAFCAHLIRERPVEAGVAPGFTELEEAENAALRRRAWRESIDRARSTRSTELHELLEAGIAPHELDEAFAIVCNFADAEFPPGDGPKPETGVARQGLETFARTLEADLPQDIPLDGGCDLQQAGRTLRGLLKHADLDNPRALAELLAQWTTTPHMTQKYWPGTPKERKELKAKLDALALAFQQTTVQPFLSAWRQYIYRLALTLILQGRTHFTTARQAALTLNYEDLLQTAALLLRENAHVRGALQDKFRWIFVDEFQDTDPVQAEVMLLLAATPGAGGRWTEVPLRPGSLFVVGDPKQSIFRFRRADIETYQRVRQRIEQTGGRVVSLTASFRAIPALCDWANTTFSQIFPQESTPQQPAFHGLHAVRQDPTTASGGLFLLDMPDSVKEGAIRSVEAERIAAYIRDAMDSSARRPGDVLIITRKKRALGEYARALERLRIPVEVSGASAMIGAPLVTALTLLLRVLSDPDDGPAVIGLLRGPLFGLSDEALYHHNAAGRSFLLTVPLDEAEATPVTDALSTLRIMYGWIRTLPGAAAVERILESAGLMALAATTSPGAADAAALQQAVDLIRAVSDTGGSLADAVATLEEELEAGQLETVPLEPGQRDVVRVMNLHKAKGLEAPVVFLADPLGGVTPRAHVRILRHGASVTGYLQLLKPNGPYSSTVIGEPADWATHEREELGYLAAEESRLLYVACTRAKERLIIGRWLKPGGRGTRPWGPLEPTLAHTRSLPSRPIQHTGRTSRPAFDGRGRAAAGQDRDQQRTKITACSWQSETVTALTHHSGKAQRVGQEPQADSGMAWGRLIHGMLEHAMRHPDYDRPALERLATWLADDSPELREVVPIAVDTVERVRTSDVWQEALAADERLVEVPFCITMAGETPPRLLTGVIDVLYRNSKGWHLVDYKTDRVPLAALCDLYGDQIRQYARHWAAISQEPLVYAGLYSTSLGMRSQDLHNI